MPSKFSEWSAAVKARDGKCCHCGTTDDLHAHHIKPKATHPELSLDVANGMTLCYRCHKAEHAKHRQPTIRKAKQPHRKTLMHHIKELEEENQRLRELNREHLFKYIKKRKYISGS